MKNHEWIKWVLRCSRSGIIQKESEKKTYKYDFFVVV